jgi:hypothetical protein
MKRSKTEGEAHWGEENKFVYDRIKGEWVLASPSSSSSSSLSSSSSSSSSSGLAHSSSLGGLGGVSTSDEYDGGGGGGGLGDYGGGMVTVESGVGLVDQNTEELLEQHAITLAIQAAHLAAEWQRLGHMPGGGGRRSRGHNSSRDRLRGRQHQQQSVSFQSSASLFFVDRVEFPSFFLSFFLPSFFC